jgi:hypothetical protein
MPAAHTPQANARTSRSASRKNVLALASSNPQVTLSHTRCSERGIFRAVLSSKITPRQSVEDVCTKLVQAGPYSRYKYQSLLMSVGLIVRLNGERPRLVLLSAFSFESAFPSLKHAVPLLEANMGILVGTAGEPFAPIKLTVVKRH